MRPIDSVNVATATRMSSDTVFSARLRAYVELTKLRISVMVLLTFVVTGILAATTASDPIPFGVLLTRLFWGTIGMALVAFSGNAANMYLERYSDFLMPRTASRPLPSARLNASEVALFTAISLGAGTAILWQAVNWQIAICGLANWILYALIYTPLKKKHWVNTEIGAVAGALPIIMGSLATTESVGLIGWSFFGVLFFWQFPHFMAIAWKYRDQYRAGGLKMLTVTEPSGRAAGIKAVVTAVLLIGVSLLPIVEARTWFQAVLLLTLTLGLGGYYLRASWLFLLDRNDRSAKHLLRSSLFYLPLYMLVLMIVCLT